MTTNAPIAELIKKNNEKIRSRMPRTQHPSPVLQFTPTAWAKLLYLRDAGNTEVGGFGISHPDDLLLVEDVRLVKQVCTAVTVKFDDASVADFFDEQVDLGRQPQQCGRIWVHTHPGNSPAPSGTDERTFARCFGESDWALMFILAQGGQTYVRLRFNVGPGGAIEVPVEVDFTQPFPAADHAAWEREYDENVAVPHGPDLWSRRRDLLAWEGDFLEEQVFGDVGEQPFLEGDKYAFDG